MCKQWGKVKVKSRCHFHFPHCPHNGKQKQCPLRAPGSLPTKTPDFPSAVCVAVQSLSRVWLFVTPWTAVLRLLCPPLSPGICSNSGPLSWWWFCGSSQTLKALETSTSVIVITYRADYRTGRLSLQCDNGSHVLSTDHMVTLCCLFTHCFLPTASRTTWKREQVLRNICWWTDGWVLYCLTTSCQLGLIIILIISMRKQLHTWLTDVFPGYLALEQKSQELKPSLVGPSSIKCQRQPPKPTTRSTSPEWTSRGDAASPHLKWKSSSHCSEPPGHFIFLPLLLLLSRFSHARPCVTP